MEVSNYTQTGANVSEKMKFFGQSYEESDTLDSAVCECGWSPT